MSEPANPIRNGLLCWRREPGNEWHLLTLEGEPLLFADPARVISTAYYEAMAWEDGGPGLCFLSCDGSFAFYITCIETGFGPFSEEEEV